MNKAMGFPRPSLTCLGPRPLWVLGLLAVLIQGLEAGSEVTLDLNLTPERCRVGDLVTLTLEVGWQGDAQSYRVSKLGMPSLDGLDIVGNKTRERVSTKAGKTYFSRTNLVRFRPIRPGELGIGSAKVELVGPEGQLHSLSTQPLVLRISEARSWTGLYWALCLLATCVLLTLVSSVFRSRKKPKRSSEDIWTEHTEKVNALLIVRDHRGFYEGALELLREGFSKLLSRELPKDREGFLKQLEELGVRDSIIHLSSQLWSEIDEGRFNPEPPSGKDRERVVFQLQDLLKELSERIPK